MSGAESMATAGSVVARFDVRSQDPEFAHRVLRETFLDFTVRRSGRPEDFAFRQTGAAAPEFSVGHVRYGTDIEAEAGPGPGPVLVEVLRAGRLRAESGHEVVEAQVGVPVLLPTAPGTVFTASDPTVDGLVVHPAALDRAARSVFGIAPADLSFLSRSPSSTAAAAYLVRTMAHVERTVLHDDEVAASPLVMAEATRSLATAILSTFPNSGLVLLENGGPDGDAGPAVLRRAMSYIDEHAGENIGVDDIATAARIGVRGLQSLFRRHRDCTPLEELRRVRMGRAHTELQAADPTRGATVAAIAAQWGFSNPGRFSVRYREVYGRSPSDTLRA